MHPNHQPPIDAIQQAMRDIVSLHRVTVDQLGDLIRVQRDTTSQLHAVSEAMREVGALFREMVGAHGRVNEALVTLSAQLERMSDVDDATKHVIQQLAEQFHRAVPQLEELAGQLIGFGVLLRHLAREQERLALSALTQELERRLPTLFCRYLAQLRWGVPGVFYDEFIAQAASEELVERWLAPDLVVTGILRAGGSTVPIVVQLAVVPEVDETVLDRVSAGAALLAAAVGPVIPAVAALRPGDASEAARTRGVLVVSARSVQNWEQAVARWLTER